MASDTIALSFENLVRFYSKELRMIEGGEGATNVITSRVRRRLREEGILVYKKREWLISEKARSHLISVLGDS